MNEFDILSLKTKHYISVTIFHHAITDNTFNSDCFNAFSTEMESCHEEKIEKVLDLMSEKRVMSGEV